MILTCRRVPPAHEPFWRILSLSGLAEGDRFIKIANRWTNPGIALVEVALPPAVHDDMDAEAEAERARERWRVAAASLEGEIQRSGARVVAFAGLSLFSSMLGARDESVAIDGDDSGPQPSNRYEWTFQIHARFGGATAVAVPIITKKTPAETVIGIYRQLARLRDRVAAERRP